MDTHEALLGRRTVHKYDPRQIPPGALERALEAAMMAPNHKLTFPWRFYRVGPVGREALLHIAHRIKAQTLGEAPSALIDGKLREKMMNPAELVVFTLRRCDDEGRAREDYATLACAIQNFSLSLWAQGLGSKWSTGRITQHPSTYSALGVDSETEEIVGFVWAGHPASTDLKVPQRPALTQVYSALP